MNKNAIQKFAIWARTELIEQVKQRAYQYAITDKGYGDENATVIAGRVLEHDEKRQRQSFIEIIKKSGFKQAVEEVAYTWFNRFVALRYMEVNDFLPTHVRVFSDSSGGFNPEILKNVLHLDLEGLYKTKVSELLNANKTDELYRYLLLTQCNALNTFLPEMFERMGAYTEMLLPNNILKPEGVIGRLVKDIPEEDFRDAVQIIGWLYQYYNTEPKQAVFDGLKKNIKITKENIPAATQLFTPDWIVRYMVENSLGRLWLESRPDSSLRANWKYYLDEAEQTPEVAERLRVLRSENAVKSPEDIKVIDPCMGSGHILVYAFDVLMQIYTSEGYSERDAAKLILEKNLYGLEIDRRAYQLAYFALMMKARQYNRRILTQGVRPQVYEPTGYADGMEYGSLVRVDKLEPMPEQPEGQLTLFDDSYDAKLNAWNFRRLLAQKYDVVVTNPPYMGNKGMTAKMSEYVQKNFPDSKSDLFSCFIERGLDWIKPTGYNCMVTMQSWMFLSSFETMRKKILSLRTITNLLHMENMVMGIAFGTAVANLYGHHIADYKGQYNYMTMKDIEDEKPVVFPTAHKRNCTASAENFEKIPGSPVAYWASNQLLSVFEKERKISDIAKPRVGQNTGDNERFLRLWHEVSNDKIGLNTPHSKIEEQPFKWIPYSKGGPYRKWYGNYFYLINWNDNGREIKEYAVVRNNGKHWSRYIQNLDFLCIEGVTWSDISSSKFSCRYLPQGFICDVKGSSAYPQQSDLLMYMATLNSVFAEECLRILAPTISFQTGDISRIPYPSNSDKNQIIKELASDCIKHSMSDWDAFETSWDFKRHPLICGERTVAASFSKWEHEAAERFDTLKANEEELNRIFIDIYGLQGELSPEVEDKDVSVRRADLGREIRSLISYAMGCMLGRYSLDCEGLAYAGGDWDAGKYKTLPADKDNIIPICDDEYFDDDIAGRFVEFVKTVYAEDTLEENLLFIADALGGKGTPREVIRNYFLNDFYKDHLKIYQKRPIYWLFDSGKKNGFKALIYMHRYSSDLLAKLRTDYVHEQQERYRTQLSHISGALNTATGAERARLLKQQERLTEQLRELTVFEEKVHHLADQKITIDLDDGVKKNYEIFTDVLAKI
ncbi:type II deoxyribonuclease [Paenibacillus stellifer]|uniref:site-specific DNA-methyltransferase (adenine-specific) n=1 Tax=Paenibacillus stellifer TaxID=169760 RepID=A0A089LLN7_9BACL|nr:BREX-1 system adenine-specific DNA-methyltransferase PglX [Paenibacillus stellifer]AIQ62426.1 type II deoxyribonuclease [Paenibacillus stellifer]